MFHPEILLKISRIAPTDDLQVLDRSYTEIQIVIPDDIIHAAPAIAQGAAAIGAAIPFTAIVKRMLGPAADELAEMWRDQVRLLQVRTPTKVCGEGGTNGPRGGIHAAGRAAEDPVPTSRRGVV